MDEKTFLMGKTVMKDETSTQFRADDYRSPRYASTDEPKRVSEGWARICRRRNGHVVVNHNGNEHQPYDAICSEILDNGGTLGYVGIHNQGVIDKEAYGINIGGKEVARYKWQMPTLKIIGGKFAHCGDLDGDYTLTWGEEKSRPFSGIWELTDIGNKPAARGRRDGSEIVIHGLQESKLYKEIQVGLLDYNGMPAFTAQEKDGAWVAALFSGEESEPFPEKPEGKYVKNGFFVVRRQRNDNLWVLTIDLCDQQPYAQVGSEVFRIAGKPAFTAEIGSRNFLRSSTRCIVHDGNQGPLFYSVGRPFELKGKLAYRAETMWRRGTMFDGRFYWQDEFTLENSIKRGDV